MGVLLIALIAITIMVRNGGGTVIWVILCGLLLLPAILATGTAARTRRLSARISQEQHQQGYQQQSLGGPQHTTQPFTQAPPMVVQPYQTLGYQPTGYPAPASVNSGHQNSAARRVVARASDPRTPAPRRPTQQPASATVGYSAPGSEIDLDDAVSRMRPGSDISLDDAVSRMRPGSDISLDDLALPGSPRRSGSARPAPARSHPARPSAPTPSSAIRSGSGGSSAIGTSLASASVLGSSLTASSLLGSGSCLLQNALQPTTVTHSSGAGADPHR